VLDRLSDEESWQVSASEVKRNETSSTEIQKYSITRPGAFVVHDKKQTNKQTSEHLILARNLVLHKVTENMPKLFRKIK
jgi:hypothetical protein